MLATSSMATLARADSLDPFLDCLTSSNDRAVQNECVTKVAGEQSGQQEAFFNAAASRLSLAPTSAPALYTLFELLSAARYFDRNPAVTEALALSHAELLLSLGFHPKRFLDLAVFSKDVLETKTKLCEQHPSVFCVDQDVLDRLSEGQLNRFARAFIDMNSNEFSVQYELARTCARRLKYRSASWPKPFLFFFLYHLDPKRSEALVSYLKNDEQGRKLQCDYELQSILNDMHVESPCPRKASLTGRSNARKSNRLPSKIR